MRSADVAIRGGKIAAVAPGIDPAAALKTVDVAGLYVTPGLIDIHVHVFAGTGERSSFVGRPERRPGRVHLPQRGHGRGRCRLRRLAELRGVQGTDHRPLADPRLRLPQYRRPGDARAPIRARPRGHAGPADGGDGAPPQGGDRGDQDGPLPRPGFHGGGAGRRGGDAGRHPRDGRFRPGLPAEDASPSC